MGQFDLFKPFFNVFMDVVKIEPGYCYYWIFKNRNMIKILKQSGHDFSGKRLWADSVLRYYVMLMYGGQHST